MNKNEIVIPFAPISDCDVPIVKFNISDTEHYAIVDTAAETTIFNSSISDLIESKKKEDVSIVGVSGETNSAIIIKGETKIWMKNDSGHLLILNVSGYINDITHISSHFLKDIDSDLKIDAILGSDMLNNFSAKIDFIKKQVYFKL